MVPLLQSLLLLPQVVGQYHWRLGPYLVGKLTLLTSWKRRDEDGRERECWVYFHLTAEWAGLGRAPKHRLGSDMCALWYLGD